MTLQATCDNWLSDLQSNVTGLGTSSVTTHLYAPYSLEAISAGLNERHLAIWPEGEPEVAAALLAGSPASDTLTQSYVILVWEDMSAESARRFDDDTSNIAWLTLYEATRARLYVQANMSGSAAKGGANTLARYQGGTLDRQNSCRYMALRFTVQVPQEYT